MFCRGSKPQTKGPDVQKTDVGTKIRVLGMLETYLGGLKRCKSQKFDKNPAIRNKDQGHSFFDWKNNGLKRGKSALFQGMIRHSQTV